MTPVGDPGPPGYRAVATLCNALMTGLVLSLVSRRGSDCAREFLFRHFRRQHHEKFLPGLRKLGLEGMPDAVACALYHYHSNALGGVKTEYFRESDRKAWVRYPPPRWIWKGTAICAIPTEVNEAMLHGWHGHNGVSLGNPRLGFVCTGQTVEGNAGLEGYYFEYERPIAETERVRFVQDEHMPAIDADAQPRLDSASWPVERLDKTYRSYAMEYVRSFMPVLAAQLGTTDAMTEIGRTARLIGLQYFEETALQIGAPATGDAAAFASYLSAMLAAQGERIALARDGSRACVRQEGWHLMRGVAFDDPGGRQAALRAWAELWSGALAAFDRRRSLELRIDGERLDWRVS